MATAGGVAACGEYGARLSAGIKIFSAVQPMGHGVSRQQQRGREGEHQLHAQDEDSLAELGALKPSSCRSTPMIPAAGGRSISHHRHGGMSTKYAVKQLTALSIEPNPTIIASTRMKTLFCSPSPPAIPQAVSPATVGTHTTATTSARVIRVLDTAADLIPPRPGAGRLAGGAACSPFWTWRRALAVSGDTASQPSN